MRKVDVLAAFERITEPWDPRVAAQLNGQHVRLARLRGAFVWHRHEHEDELFYVVRGRLRIEFRDRSVELGENELLVVPRGVEHRPVAEPEALVMLFEPASTVNTGDVRNERTVRDPRRLDPEEGRQ
ncbi:MAG: cupin domain-containing protein [Acidobacteriota bacterium]